jgi:hypothetical protein
MTLDPPMTALRPNGERRSLVLGACIVDVERPRVALAPGKWECTKVDSERNPKFAPWGYTRWTTGLELPVQADRFLADDDGVAVFVGEVEAPLVFDIRLIPRHTDSNSDRNLLRTWTDDAQPAAENEELAVGDLHSIGHKHDGSKHRRIERQVWLVHGEDPTGSAIGPGVV